MQCVSFFPCEDFSPYKQKVLEFQPWSGRCPPTQHHVLGQHRICWEAAAGAGGERDHLPQHIPSACGAEPPLRPAAPTAWDQGAIEKLLMRCWQRWASSAAAAGDWEREVKSLYGCTWEFLNASHFWAEYCCGKSREERSVSILTLNHPLPHSWGHIRITLPKFSNMNEFKIKLVQDPLYLLHHFMHLGSFFVCGYHLCYRLIYFAFENEDIEKSGAKRAARNCFARKCTQGEWKLFVKLDLNQ